MADNNREDNLEDGKTLLKKEYLEKIETFEESLKPSSYRYDYVDFIEVNGVYFYENGSIKTYLSQYAMGDKFKHDYESNIYTFKFNGKEEECEYVYEDIYDVLLGKLEDYTLEDFKIGGRFLEEFVPLYRKQKGFDEKKSVLFKTLQELNIIDKNLDKYDAWITFKSGNEICGPVNIDSSGVIKIGNASAARLTSYSAKAFEVGGRFIEKFMPQLNQYKENKKKVDSFFETLQKARLVNKDQKIDDFLNGFGSLDFEFFIIHSDGTLYAYCNKYALGRKFTSKYDSDNRENSLNFMGKKIICDFDYGYYSIEFGNFSDYALEDFSAEGRFSKEIIPILKREKEFNEKKEQIEQSLKELKIISDSEFYHVSGEGVAIGDHFFISNDDGSLNILGENKGKLKDFSLKDFQSEGKFIQENLKLLKKMKLWNEKKEIFKETLQKLKVENTGDWDSICLEFKSISKATFYDDGKITVILSSDGLTKALKENDGKFKFNGRVFNYNRVDYDYIICDVGTLDNYSLKDFKNDGAFTLSFMHLLELDAKDSEKRENMYEAFDILTSDLEEIYDSAEKDYSDEPEFANEGNRTFVEKMQKYADENGLELGFKYFYLSQGVIDSELVEKSFNAKNYAAFKRLYVFYADADNFDLDDDSKDFYEGLPDTVELYFRDIPQSGKVSIFPTDKDLPEDIENEIFEHQIVITPSIFKRITICDHEAG